MLSFGLLLRFKRDLKLEHLLFPAFFYSSFQMTSLLYASNTWNSLFGNLLLFLFLACVTGLHYIYKITD